MKKKRAALKRLAESQLSTKQRQLKENLAKQDSHYDASDTFEPITKTVKDASEKLFDDSKATTKALDDIIAKLFVFRPEHGEEKPVKVTIGQDLNVSAAITRGRRAYGFIEIKAKRDSDPTNNLKKLHYVTIDKSYISNYT